MSLPVFRILRPILGCVLVLTNLSSLALTPTVKKLVEWETRANAVATRSADPIALNHYEIPLRLLQKDLAKNLDPKVREALIFKKDGEDYVRWIINPEDTKWHLKIAEFLSAQGLDATPKTHFTAYLTASRSMILEDPINKAQFSAKVSTNNTGGLWKDKQQGIDDAKQVRMASDRIRNIYDKTQFDRLLIMEEPLQLGIEELDQAFLVRSLEALPKGDHYYIPGFSVLHESTGTEIALKNGSKNPQQYWNEHYNKPLAEALAEFSAYFGLTFDSPHSQNFLVELDRNLKPTGKIVLRDFGDSYAQTEYFAALGDTEFLKQWERGNLRRGSNSMSIGVLHGNEFPSWMSDANYINWNKDFYEVFEKKISTLTEIPLADLQGTTLNRNGAYFLKSYSTQTQGWQKYFAMALCFSGSPVKADGTPCPETLKARIKKPATARGSCATSAAAILGAVR